LEPYGWSEADIHQLVLRCESNEVLVQEAVSNVLEDRGGHEHGQWSSIDTVSEKKEKGAAAKERKAQREKERSEEEEREKQRRAKMLEEEKKRHLEKEARKQAYLEQKKHQPGSALVRSSGAISAPVANAWRQEEAEENKDAVDSSPNDDSRASENQASVPMEESQDSIQHTTEYLGQISPRAASRELTSCEVSAAAVKTPAKPHAVAGDQSSDMCDLTSAPSVAPSSQQEMPRGAKQWQQGSSQTVPWSSQWCTEQASNAMVIDKAQRGSPSSRQTPLTFDTVVMPRSFWDLMGNRPVPQVMFGSLCAPSASTTAQQTETPAKGAPQDAVQKFRRGRSAPYSERDGKTARWQERSRWQEKERW
jgi:hypothetical protein